MTHTDPNDRIEYTMWSVFRHNPGQLPRDRTPAIQEAEAFFGTLGGASVALRGLYRVSGLRADADWMVWWHGPTITALQDAYNMLRTTAWGRASTPVWSAAGVHRVAEFNREHAPAYMRGAEPARFLSVYPFVRSYDWYLLPEEERRHMLINHGAAARAFPDIISNTVAAFSLGDYEWLLALEADELHRLVDLLRAFRSTEARRHVREETPFYTGERSDMRSLIGGLP